MTTPMPPTDMYFDRQGQPMTYEAWVERFRDFGYRVIAKTEVSPEVQVSTVWLGLNHNWDDGPPLIFETLVFGGPMDGEMLRYATEEEAVKGHESMSMLAAARSALDAEVPEP
jgi:hypothetical protein